MMKDNPFVLLGALPCDSRKRLQELRDNAQLLGRQEVADAAYAALIKPQSRLEAELWWFPEKENGEKRPIWRLNRLMEKADTTRNKRLLLMKACKYWGNYNSGEVLAAINADREQGGWKTVQPDELRDGIKAYLNEMAASLDGLYQYDAACDKSQKKLIKSYAAALLAIIARYNHGTQGFADNELVETLVGRYELRFAALAEELREKLIQIAATRKNPSAAGWSAREINCLLHELQEWSTLTMPMRKLNDARGLRSETSEALADEIRLFMAEVYNRFDNTKAAKRLICKLRDCFPEYEWLQDQLVKDKAIVRHEEQRKKLEAQEKREKKFMPFGVLMIVLAIIMNRCDPGQPAKRSNAVPPPAEDSLRAAQVFFTNQNLTQKAQVIEEKEAEIQRAILSGNKAEVEKLNEELRKLRSEYVVLRVEAEQMIKSLQND